MNWQIMRSQEATSLFLACSIHTPIDVAMAMATTERQEAGRLFKKRPKMQPEPPARLDAGDWRAHRWMESRERFANCCRHTPISAAERDLLNQFLPKMAARTARASFCVETVASVFRMQGEEAAAMALEMAMVV